MLLAGARSAAAPAVLAAALFALACGSEAKPAQGDLRVSSEISEAPKNSQIFGDQNPLSPEPSSVGSTTTTSVEPVETTVAEIDPASQPGSVRAVTGAELAESWRNGCPTGPDELVALSVPYVDFEGDQRVGTLIVRDDLAIEITEIFLEIASVGFPIRLVEPVSKFGASDDYSMAFDNTSAFNCRPVAGTLNWSKHSDGVAIDINPLENPWVRSDGAVYPPQGAAFIDRSSGAKGLITAEGPVVKAFTSRGWTWGGSWSEPDYQHFVKD